MKNVSWILPGLLVLTIACPWMAAAQDAAPAESSAAEAPAAEEVALPAADPQPVVPLIRPDKISYSAGLQVDGNLVGRIRLDDGSGKPIPVMANLAFFLEGQLVDASRTGPGGYFQVTRLVEGTYMVAAVSRYGEVTFEVEVGPFDRSAAMEETLLDVLLLPNVDPELLEQMVRQQPCSICGETCGGVCCGGGHQVPWGLAGLAGLAGLCDDDDKPATPYKPYGHD